MPLPEVSPPSSPRSSLRSRLSRHPYLLAALLWLAGWGAVAVVWQAAAAALAIAPVTGPAEPDLAAPSAAVEPPQAWLIGAAIASGLLALMAARLALSERRAAGLAESLQQQRRDQAHWMDGVFEPMAEGVVVTDEQGRILHTNRSAQRLFGQGAARLAGRNFQVLLAQGAGGEAQLPALHTLPAGARLQLQGRRADGARFPMALTLSVFTQQGHTRRVAVLRDLSDSQAAAASLAESAQALRAADTLREAVFQNAAFALVVSDAQGTIRAMNPAAERLLATRAADEVGASTLSSLHPRDDLPALTEMLRHHLHEARDGRAARATPGAEPPPRGLGLERAMHYQRRDGRTVPVSVTVSALHGDDGQVSGFLCIAYDTTERLHLAERLSQLAYHDSLTGLPNRVLLEQRLTAAIGQARSGQQPLALLFIDLDRFKPVNDTHGHAVGDQVLCEVARRLRGALRERDLLARLGGDEFVVVLNALARLDDAPLVADKLLTALAPPMDIGPLVLSVGASVGVARWPESGEDAAALLRSADKAMYEAKHAGRETLRQMARVPAG